MKIALIGTGLMGFPMAERLLETNHQPIVYNRTRDKAEPLAELGAEIADSPLDAIASAGHLLFVATAKPHRHAARIVEHFGMSEFFATVYGSELDGTRGTKTELLEFAIDRNPGGTRHVMVGDRKHDLIGAVANQMTPVGVAYGYGSVEELEGAGAAAIATSPADLPGILI